VEVTADADELLRSYALMALRAFAHADGDGARCVEAWAGWQCEIVIRRRAEVLYRPTPDLTPSARAVLRVVASAPGPVGRKEVLTALRHAGDEYSVAAVALALRQLKAAGLVRHEGGSYTPATPV
jgi:hypothetical protein